MRQAAPDRSGGLAGTDYGELNQPGPPPPSVSLQREGASDNHHTKKTTTSLRRMTGIQIIQPTVT
jgi:hypothetical protein